MKIATMDSVLMPHEHTSSSVEKKNVYNTHTPGSALIASTNAADTLVYTAMNH